jgi:LuxR family maltose regulon positive regulatory protein
MPAGGEFVAVATKLLVPELRAGLVPRPALIDALESGRTRRATLVAAATGFGKTSALAEWAATSPARFAWLSLDEGDDDPNRFWSYLVAAIDRAVPELPSTAARRLRGPGVMIADEVLPVLVNELTTPAQPLVIVLDDYHVITDDEIHAGVQYLLERLGSDVHVVIAAQSVPPLRLGRLRARGELNECRAETLRFSGPEVAALLNGAHGLGLDPEELAGVYRRTEGWVAGLNLVALSLRDTDDRAAFLAGLPVDDRFLVDYLWDEVVAGQPEDTRTFLMRTAVLERLSSELCDAVLDRDDSADMLLALERSNLFVVPLDSERRWFRYHGIFRAMLVRQLERFSPDSVAELHRRASAWFAERGDLAGTIEHALSAADWHTAAETLRRSWLGLYSDGKANDMIGWLARLPRTTIAEYPELALARGGVSRAMGRPIEEVEPWFALAEHAARDTDDAELRANLTAGVARQRAMLRLNEGNVGEAVRLGRAAVAARPPGSVEGPSDSYFLAICLFWTGLASREAETRLRDFLDAAPPGDMDVRRVYAMALLAVAHAQRGEIDVAERLVEESLKISEGRNQTEHPSNQLVYVAAGIVLLARGDVEGAEDLFEHAAALARRGADAVEIVHALLWLGRCRVRAGDPGGAAEALEAARALLPDALVPVLVSLTDEVDAEVRAAPAPPPVELTAEANGFSEDEQRVLELLPTGLTYREIATRLDVPLPAVRSHNQRIRRKLGVSTRAEAVTAARRLDLL